MILRGGLFFLIVMGLLPTSASAAKHRAHVRKKPVKVVKPPPADQPPLEVQPSLEEAMRLYGGGHYSAAISMLDKLPQTAQRQWYLAMSFLAIDDTARAQSALVELATREPDYAPPTSSASALLALFTKVKADHHPPVAIEHVPPASIEATLGASLDVTLRHMRAGYQGKLFYRLKGAAFFSSSGLVTVQREQYVGKLSADALNGPALEYFFVVSAGADTVQQQLRTPDNPFAVSITQPVLAPVPVYRKWWFWTLLSGAVLAAAAGTTAAILLTRPEPANGNAHITLQL